MRIRAHAGPVCLFLMLLNCSGCRGPEGGHRRYSIEQFVNTISIKGAAFSPDEEEVLFSSNREGVFNAYSVPVGGGEARAITRSKKTPVHSLSYFPHDRRILFSQDVEGNGTFHIFVRNEDGSQRDLTPQEGARTEFLGWARDRKSFFFASNARKAEEFDLYEMDIRAFQSRRLFRNEGGFILGPVSDDRRYVAVYKPHSEFDSDLHLYDRETETLEHISPHEGDVFFQPVCFEVGSSSLYYLTDEGSEFHYIKRYEATWGGTETVEKADWDVVDARFSRTGRYFVVTINNDARTEIRIHDVKTGEPVSLPKMPEGQITSVVFSDSEKRVAFYLNGARSANDLYVYDFEERTYQKLTASLDPDIDPGDLVEPRVVRFRSFDGLEIPAIYYEPKGLDDRQLGPGLIWAHGGGQSRILFSPLIQYLVNHGYSILAVNARGSWGYGKTFLGLNSRRQGRDDLSDCIEGKKFLVETGLVDERRIGIIGGSYGGFLVLSGLVFRENEFAVGVDLFGISNWIHTLESIPPWWEALRELLYQEIGHPVKEADYLKEISPLFHAGKIERPLLIFQGANDPRVSARESEEIVKVVRENGTPVEYILFEDEGHGVEKRENQIRLYRAIRRFLDEHLKGEKSS